MSNDNSEQTALESAQAVQDLRARVLAGEEVTPQQYRQVIDSIRRSRLAAAAPTGKKKAVSTPIELYDL